MVQSFVRFCLLHCS
ncbi:rCG39315 [Rattus norvegicus]|uniref:RCG39315 n=1 Tax=Rattus norvegicus TaxID=10116 RepID=A6I8S1_RAT|nr:rCG39315 [Rattus norvegicus]